MTPALTPALSPRERRTKPRTYSLGTRVGLAALVSLCALDPTARADGPAVTVITAAQGVVVQTVPVTGTMVAREDVLVSPQIDGLAIIEIDVEEGDVVRAGQVLARLSRETLDTSLAENTAQIAHAEAALAEARAQLAEAQANRVQAATAFGRTSALIGSGAASRETFDQRQMAAQTTAAREQTSQAGLLAAQADVDLARAQRQELMVRAARTDIRSPVAGRVSRRVARLGAVVASAGDPLFRVITDDAVELEADVPETLLARLRPGQVARVVLTGETQPRVGTVRLVAPELNRTTRLGRVRIAVAGGSATIGGFARAEVETGRREGMVVPLSAVLFQADGDRVQVVRDGVVHSTAVRVGARDAARAEVDGLADGDRVVAVSGSFVRDGDRVTAVAGK